MGKNALSDNKKSTGVSCEGIPNIIKEVNRNSKTAKKYDVSTETVSADDLQSGVDYPQQ